MKHGPRHVRPGAWFLAALLLVAPGCDGDRPADPSTDQGSTKPAMGSERGPCYPNGTCNKGLTCASKLCVRLGDGGTPDGPSTDSRKDGPVPDSPWPDGPATDGVLFDVTVLPDGWGNLWACKTPGQGCNPHNPCAVLSICGNDLLCHPVKIYDCSDKLACTKDTCLGMGVCSNKAVSGYCALPVKVGASFKIQCLKDGAKDPADPCMACDSSKSSNKWSPQNGGTCDDNSLCTKSDYCQNGQCKGTYYGAQCSDGLSCTTDLCDGKGGCLGNKLSASFCLINKVCYKDGAKHPGGSCFLCDVKKSQSAWTSMGNTCLIGGKCYQAGDKDSTGCGVCDPKKSATAWTLTAGLCKINGKCYKDGAKHAGNCAICDPKKSSTSWTVVGTYCLISDACKKPKDKDATGCGVCDPSTDKYAWTMLPGLCKITGKCYTKGTLDSSKCGQCDPVTSSTSWTPLKGKCMIQGACYADKTKHASGCLVCEYSTNPLKWTVLPGVKTSSWGFEKGSTSGWTISNTSTLVGWQASSNRASGGTYSLYYGNPKAKNYNTSGTKNSGMATSPPITLTAGKKAGLSFMIWKHIESTASYDKLTVSVNNTVVWQKSTSPKMSQWIPVYVDLASYAGKNVSIQFKFDTQDSVANTTEGIYVDEIYVHHGC